MSTTIKYVSDLSDAASSGKVAELFPTLDQWLPQLIASVSWSVRLSPHFMLLYYRDTDHIAPLDQDAFLIECEQCRDQILQYFGNTPSNKMEHDSLKSQLTLLILHIKSTMTFGNMLRPNLLLYLLDREQDPDYMVKMRHEMAHWLWGSLYGEAPAFLNEGVAVVAETLSAPDKTEADLFRNLRPIDEVPPLDELCKNDIFWKTGTAFYRIAATFVYFLSQSSGWELVRELFRHTDYDDAAICSSFAHVYGASLNEADLQWRSFFRAKIQEYCQS